MLRKAAKALVEKGEINVKLTLVVKRDDGS
jgi:hypothetical protein